MADAASSRPLRPSVSAGRSSSQDQRALETLVLFVGGALVVTCLALGKQVFLPIAIAVLLSFVLAGPVNWMRTMGVPRVPSVILVTTFAVMMLALAGLVLVRQATQLANDLPTYQSVIVSKVDTLRAGLTQSPLVERALQTLRSLDRQTKAPVQEQQKGTAPSEPARAEPVPVEVHQPSPGPFEVLLKLAASIFEPLATSGLVIVFVVFILLQREDLRDRLIRLAGAQDLSRTTAAIDDAAQRLSRYLLTLTAMNAGFGVIIGLGLTFIGVPSPVLWGVLAMMMRFVPYIGAFVAAVLPVTLAAAVDPGWSMVFATAALFAITEPILGQVIDPLVYGHSTGLSPLAVLIAAIFWTWLWGPVGLLLATPLTVCLVVLGRHVERLSFLDILLGDQPALTPVESFYQRMLAGHTGEAAEDAEAALQEAPLYAWCDSVARDGLLLAQGDLDAGRLTVEQQEKIRDSFLEVLDDLDTQDSPAGSASAPDTRPTIITATELGPEWRGPAPVLILPARGPLDEAVGAIFAQLLVRQGLPARTSSPTQLSAVRIHMIDLSGVALVCFVCLGTRVSEAALRFALRRLRRRLPKSHIMLCCWAPAMDPALEKIARAAGADLVTASLTEAVRLCLDQARAQSSSAI